MRFKLNAFYLLAALTLSVCMPSNADVPTPPTPPAPPAGYCTTIYNELQGYLDTFNQTLGTPSKYPTLQFSQLQMADSNTGPAISGANYLTNVMVQVQQLKAMGFQGVKVEVAFPILYEPYWGSTAAMQPYLTFYTNLAQQVHALGLKLLIENNVTLSSGSEAGWANIGTYYASLSWTQFIAARATMAGTIASAMQPDFLMLSEEPDNEAVNAGQPNLNNPLLAGTMIAGEITAARLGSPSAKLGAGFGTWLGPFEPSGLLDYLTEYVTLPLDYIDMHIYPIATEYGGLSNFLNNALIVANGAAAALKPVAISESWPWKMENAEFNVVSEDVLRARDPFSFWAPLDSYFVQTMENLANYTQMLYLTSQGNDEFLAYQTYGGTTANGGAATCSCTTQTCSTTDIVDEENSLAIAAGQMSTYTSTGLFYDTLLIIPPDTTPPSAPGNLTGTAGFSSATLAWTGSTDNVGVAGYNVLRCTPAPCTGTWIANTADTSYVDIGLNDNTSYEYTVQAFDITNNNSQLSNTLSLTTALNTPPTSPTNLSATAVSPKQINLAWTAPSSSTGLSKYLIYSGPSSSNLVQIATAPATATSFSNQPLNAQTTYYYGVIAVVKTLNSPMSGIASATTLPLPNPPTNLKASSTSATKITLTWTEVPQPGGLAIANYQVYRGTVPGVYTKVATTTTTTYNNTGLTPNTTYYFEVVAVDKSLDDSPPSDPISFTTPPLPNAPTNLAATTPAATKITLTWQWTQAPGGLAIARFNVFCGTTPTGQPQVGTSLTDTFNYTTATAATQYYCYVVAVDSGNDSSPNSSTLPVKTPPMPNAPTNVQATSSSATKVTVTWTETKPTGGLNVTSYKIYRSTTLPVTLSNYVATRTTTSYTDTTVTGGITYYYAISAIDSGADASPLSATAQVTTP